MLQQDFMQLDYVERLLTDGQAGEDIGGVGIGMVQEERAVGGDGQDAGSGAPTLRRMAVARDASMGASSSSMSKKTRAELRKASSEKEGRL